MGSLSPYGFPYGFPLSYGNTLLPMGFPLPISPISNYLWELFN